MKFTLIEDAKRWYKMASVHVAARAAVQISWTLFPDDQKITLLGAFIPKDKVSVIIAVIGFVVLVSARVVKQDSVSSVK